MIDALEKLHNLESYLDRDLSIEDGDAVIDYLNDNPVDTAPNYLAELFGFTTRDNLTLAQVEALIWWTEKHGRKWKDALREAWMTGNYGYHIPMNHDTHLQRLRNTRGNAWLHTFKWQIPSRKKGS